jgi:hypothetical protein
MKARDFCYWLQGFFELNGIGDSLNESLNADQIKAIRNHLNLVFLHEIDPSFKGDRKAAQAVHDGEPTDDGVQVWEGDGQPMPDKVPAEQRKQTHTPESIMDILERTKAPMPHLRPIKKPNDKLMC